MPACSHFASFNSAYHRAFQFGAMTAGASACMYLVRSVAVEEKFNMISVFISFYYLQSVNSTHTHTHSWIKISTLRARTHVGTHTGKVDRKSSACK